MRTRLIRECLHPEGRRFDPGRATTRELLNYADLGVLVGFRVALQSGHSVLNTSLRRPE